MSITDELREWARNRAFVLSDPLFAERVDTYADNIDKAHTSALQCAHDAGFDEGFASADDWYADHADELREHGWVMLPRDADGEVWHVGDRAIGEVNPRNPKAIERMLWYGPESGWQLETDAIIYPCPDRPRHYHEPTVEDVLREFGKAWVEWEDGSPFDPIADYADRIREVLRDE